MAMSQAPCISQLPALAPAPSPHPAAGMTQAQLQQIHQGEANVLRPKRDVKQCLLGMEFGSNTVTVSFCIGNGIFPDRLRYGNSGSVTVISDQVR